ncbi:MAG: ABC transporter permease [Candidatus Rokubacteria bacterium]|nr:ABC transporter permease [Candidatus Rokubacteria bacterium]
MERIVQAALLPVFIGTWEVSGRLGWLDTRVLSLPSSIAARTVADVASGLLLHHTAVTLAEMVLGFLAGALTGLLCGLVLGAFPLARHTLMPYLAAIYSIPRPALAPLFVLWFGVGFLSKLVLVVTLVYFVFLLHVVAGLQTIEARHVDWLRTLGASRRQVLQRVGIPHLLPWLFASTKLGLALALIGAIVGEFISSRAGLGFVMMHAAENLDREGVLSGIVVLSGVVMGIIIPLSALERRLFRWQVDVRL